MKVFWISDSSLNISINCIGRKLLLRSVFFYESWYLYQKEYHIYSSLYFETTIAMETWPNCMRLRHAMNVNTEFDTDIYINRRTICIRQFWSGGRSSGIYLLVGQKIMGGWPLSFLITIKARETVWLMGFIFFLLITLLQFSYFILLTPSSIEGWLLLGQSSLCRLRDRCVSGKMVVWKFFYDVFLLIPFVHHIRMATRCIAHNFGYTMKCLFSLDIFYSLFYLAWWIG